jgi:signal transduction histidine kinase
MSVRTALIGGMLLLVALTAGIAGVVGTLGIFRSVLREAQSRVDHDLKVAHSLFSRDLNLLSRQAEIRVANLDLWGGSGELNAQLRLVKSALDLTVLNLCDVDGKPLAGSFPNREVQVPIRNDSLLRQALAGQAASGTVLLNPERLLLEGGSALANALSVRPRNPSVEIDLQGALFQWFAVPLFDAGQVAALLYGGFALNHNSELVDSIRDTIFTTELHDGKPLGTVTIFLGGTRVATNVLDSSGKRAIGTQVSEEVRQEVLNRGRDWRDRAWVVDSWYLSGYRPLRDPDQMIVGMLYVGLLEAPYQEQLYVYLAQFLVPVGAVLLVVVVLGVALARRIIQPIDALRQGAKSVSEGNLEAEISEGRTYSEFSELASDFRYMQTAIRNRDARLQDQNEELALTNDQLRQTNDNYMKTLRFVTHELKSPLAAIQTMIDVVVGDYLGAVPEKAKQSLVRIKHNSEELQEMVKDYLDFSRAERGELEADIQSTELCTEVIRPCVEQNNPLFTSRSVELEVSCPERLTFHADPELIRLVLSNYLSNAAKYSREKGRVLVQVQTSAEDLVVSVWNEGKGFQPEEADTLFKKFSRLQNENTRGKRGSGLGLYLCREIIELHGGKVWAESREGEWARFSFSVPIRR